MKTHKPSRPLMRFHGSKFRKGEWTVRHFWKSKIYVDTNGGALGVLGFKPRSYAEIVNDLDKEIVNLYRVVRNPDECLNLIHLLTLTPFAREEFDLALIPSGDPVEQARRTITKSMLGFSSDAVTRGYRTGFRTGNFKSGRYCAADWASFPPSLRFWLQRLQGVVIENMDMFELIPSKDSPDTLFYVDPPYLHSTRHRQGKHHGYRHELAEAQHIQLAGVLHSIEGKAVIAHYRCPLYDEMYSDWHREDAVSYAQSGGGKGSSRRIESIWMNYKPSQMELF